MMSGLRAQREYTITCVSLRSGMASIGTVFIDHTPATVATATSKRTTKRFFADSSMRALIMASPSRRRRRTAVRVLFRSHATRPGFQLARRIDQERPRRHDSFAGGETARDGDAVSIPFTHHDLTRFEVAIAEIDEHRLPIAGVQHRFSGHEELLGSRDAKLDADVHVRLHPKSRVRRVQPHFEGARHRIHLRLDVGHLCLLYTSPSPRDS